MGQAKTVTSIPLEPISNDVYGELFPLLLMEQLD